MAAIAPTRSKYRNAIIVMTGLFVAGLLTLLLAPVGSAEELVDLTSWREQGNPANGDWRIEEAGLSVKQYINGEPTFFVSPQTFVDSTFRGSIRVETTSDDDFVGFVFGYQSPIAVNGDATNDFEFLVFDWKQLQQSFGCTAFEGYRLYRVATTSVNFWCPSGAGVQMLGTKYGTQYGWNDNQLYEFELLYQANRILIKIDGVTIFDVAGTFPAGHFGFYNYSQSHVRYKGIVSEDTPTAILQATTASVFEDDPAPSLGVQLSKASTLPVLINYTLSDGTATLGDDYLGSSGSIAIPAGATEAQIPLPIIDDADFEANETFTVTLASAWNATIGTTSSATITVVDEDEIPVADLLMALADPEDTSSIVLTDNSTWTTWPISSWAWDFGDGATSVLRDPTHTYALDGVYPITLTVTNQVGNVHIAATTHLVDHVPPVTDAEVSCTVGTNGWCQSDANLTLESFDVFGVGSILYRVDDLGAFDVYTGAVPVVGDGPHTVEFYAIDLVGNTEATKSIGIQIDTVTPDVDASFAGTKPADWYTTAVAATITATDVTSDVFSVESRVNGGPWVAGSTRSIGTQGAVTFDVRATDQAGNVAPAVSYTLPIDTVAPTLVCIYTPSAPTSFGWYGDEVTVTPSATDATSGVAFRKVVVDGVPRPSNLSHTQGDTDLDGVTTRCEAQDIATHFVSSAAKALKVDLTAPLLDVTVDGNKTGDWYTTPVTVTAHGDDALSGVARIRWSSPTLGSGTLAGDAKSWMFTQQGTHTLTVVADDRGLNPSLPTTLQLKIDLTPPDPAATSVPGPNGDGWVKATNATVTLTASDGAGSGVAGITYDEGSGPVAYGGPFLVDGEGVHLFGLGATDLVGNVLSPTEPYTLRLDGTLPQADVILDGVLGNNSTTLYTSPVTITISSSDAVSAIKTVQYGFGGVPGTTYTGPFTTAIDGDYSLVVSVTDVAGNVLDLEPLGFSVLNDDTPPTTAATLSGIQGADDWWRSAVTVRLATTDDLSPIAVTEYRIDAGPIVAYAGPFAVPLQGDHTVEYRSTDAVGNVEAWKETSFRIDSLAPITTYDVTGEVAGFGYRGTVNVTLDAGEQRSSANESVSGFDRTEYQLDGGAWTLYDGTPIEVAGTGAHAVKARSHDVAGNIEGTLEIPLYVDITPPEPVTSTFEDATPGETFPDGAPTFNTSVMVRLDGLDAGPNGTTDDVTIHYRIGTDGDFLIYEQPFGVDTEGRVTVETFAVDRFGNTGPLATFQFVIDVTLPVVDLYVDLGSVVDVEDGINLWLNTQICFRLPLRDPLAPFGYSAEPLVSGLNGVLVEVRDIATGALVFTNYTVNQVFGSLDLPAEVSVTFCDLALPDGSYSFLWYACDNAGNCGGGDGAGFLILHIDTTAPVAEIVWPPVGTVTLDGITMPLLPDREECRAAFPEDANETGLCAALDDMRAAIQQAHPDTHETINGSTVLAGQTPVWVKVTEAARTDRVDLRFQGEVLGAANLTAAVNGTDAAVKYYRFVVDVPGRFDPVASALSGDPVSALVRLGDLVAVAEDHVGHAGLGIRAVALVNADAATEDLPVAVPIGMPEPMYPDE